MKEKVRSCFENYYKGNALSIQDKVSTNILSEKIRSAAASTASQEDLSMLQVKPAISGAQYPKLSHLTEVEGHVTGVSVVNISV